MGVFNQPAQNYAAQAQKQAQQNFQQFQKNNQAYNRRAADLRGTARTGGRTPRTTADGAGDVTPAPPRFPGDEDYAEAAPKRRRGLVGWVAAVAALVFAGVAFTGWAVLLGNPLATTDDVHATVRSGTEWNVRGGPGMSFKPVAVVRPGQEISVACMESNWAKATTPVRGFVYRTGLDLAATPRPC